MKYEQKKIWNKLIKIHLVDGVTELKPGVLTI